MVEPDFDAITDMSQLPEEAFTPRRYQPGDTLEGEIVSIDDEGLVVSVGLKTEGMVPIAEMRTLAPEERAGLKLGDRMQFTVLQGERGSEMAMLSLDRARQAQMWDNLQQSLSSGDVVTAKITGHNRGGLEVEVQGIRGFVPISHAAPTSADGREKDLAVRVGQQAQFHVLELDPANERLILSERALWQQSRDAARRKFIDTLEEGALVTGKITSLRGFGAFLNLGQVDGLIPISELSWRMLRSPDEVVSVGDELTVQILKVDRENGRISLSLKRIMPEPWDTVPERFIEGDIVEGTVTRLAEFGAFVKLEDWVEGLIHISELSNRRVTNPKECVYQGQKVKVKILSIDTAKRRMSLSFKQAYGM
ncbi:MAG: 30S ribosomal protein S1 [Chloroflexi bacterium]|nr:30S ribosomal protein S1 [Chloroflexota bacterium]